MTHFGELNDGQRCPKIVHQMIDRADILLDHLTLFQRLEDSQSSENIKNSNCRLPPESIRHYIITGTYQKTNILNETLDTSAL